MVCFMKWAERGNMRKKIEWRVKEVGTGDKWGQIVEYKENEANTVPSNTAATPAKPLTVVPPRQNGITICGQLQMIE